MYPIGSGNPSIEIDYPLVGNRCRVAVFEFIMQLSEKIIVSCAGSVVFCKGGCIVKWLGSLLVLVKVFGGPNARIPVRNALMEAI